MANRLKHLKIPVLFTGIVSRWALNARLGLEAMLAVYAVPVGIKELKM